jgi:hypothetical protein
MRENTGVYDPEQLNALKSLFDQVWLAATNSSNAISVHDWAALRDLLAQRVFEYANTSLTDDEVIRAVLTSLGLL